jgi:hypothetical protein
MPGVTQEEIDALKAALRSGVRTVQQGPNAVTYASAAEMRATLREMEAELRGRRKVSYPSYSRGARG